MMRILFVDDEQQILDGLRALLRPKRHVWETTFVTSGAEALDELARSRFDVIVSDMKMPGMDGATLLRKVQGLHPGVVRIVLSGHAELESVLRTVPVAHQFLLKPCDPTMLETVIQRACDLQALINNDAIRKFASGLQTLPPLPQVYVQLTKVLEDEHSGVKEIAHIVEQDPAMCAKVLQLVNSSFIGLGRTISDVEEAIRYLGMSLLKNLTLVVQIFSARSMSDAHRLQLHRLQRHGLLVGGIARRLLASQPRLSDDAFMAGILHDIGKLVLLDQQPALCDVIEKKARLGRRPVHEVEIEVLGVSHAEIGGFLLGIWGLPYPIVEAAANHHHPGRVQHPGADVLMAVYVANHLALEQERLLGVDEGVHAPLDEEFLAAAGVLGRMDEWRAIAVSQLGESRSEYWGGEDVAKAA